MGVPLDPGTTQGGIGATRRPREKPRGDIGVFPTLGPTQGGIGAAHGPHEKFCGGTGVSLDLTTNSRRYGGRPRAPGENQWEYWGVQ